MAYDEHLADRIRRIYSALHVRTEEKRMMGGLCFMVDGKMCAGVAGDRLMARLDPAVYEEALSRPGARAMDFTGRPMKGFVFVEPEGIAAEADLRSWLQRCLDFNPRARASRKK